MWFTEIRITCNYVDRGRLIDLSNFGIWGVCAYLEDYDMCINPFHSYSADLYQQFLYTVKPKIFAGQKIHQAQLLF